MLTVESMCTMGFWKLLQSRLVFILKLTLRLALCFFAALLTTIVLPLIFSEDIIWDVPIHIAKYVVRAFFPSVVIDGEIAYDVLTTDYIVFYGGIAFLCYLYLSYKMQQKR